MTRFGNSASSWKQFGCQWVLINKMFNPSCCYFYGYLTGIGISTAIAQIYCPAVLIATLIWLIQAHRVPAIWNLYTCLSELPANPTPIHTYVAYTYQFNGLAHSSSSMSCGQSYHGLQCTSCDWLSLCVYNKWCTYWHTKTHTFALSVPVVSCARSLAYSVLMTSQASRVSCGCGDNMTID